MTMANTVDGEKAFEENRDAHIFSKYGGRILFGFVVLCYLGLTFITNHYVFKEDIYLRSYADQLSFQGIEALMDIKQRFWWTSYLVLPFIVLLKIGFSTICISIGAVLSNVEFKFKSLLKAALVAEVIFILGQIIYIVNISLHLDAVTLQTASNYYPLTALSFWGTQNVTSWLRYPLQTLNLFEVGYVLVLSWLISQKWKPDFVESLSVVFPSYATGLILWLALVVFLTLQVS